MFEKLKEQMAGEDVFDMKNMNAFQIYYS